MKRLASLVALLALMPSLLSTSDTIFLQEVKIQHRSWASSDVMPDWSLVLLLGVASLYLQFSLLIGYNQYYLLNEQLLLKSEDKINPYLSVHTTSTDNLATSGYDKFGYRCKKSRLEFHNRVSNIYILSAPSLLYLLVVLLLNLIQPTKHYPHSYFLEMLVVAKLVSLLLITPALLYLCARTTSLNFQLYRHRYSYIQVVCFLSAILVFSAIMPFVSSNLYPLLGGLLVALGIAVRMIDFILYRSYQQKPSKLQAVTFLRKLNKVRLSSKNRVNQAEEFMVSIKQFITGDQTTTLTEEMKQLLIEEMLNSVRIYQVAVPLLCNLAITSSLIFFPRPSQIFVNEYSQMREKSERYNRWLKKEREGQLILSHTIYNTRQQEKANNLSRQINNFESQDTMQEFNTRKITDFNGMVSRKISRIPGLSSFNSMRGNRLIGRNQTRLRFNQGSESDISQQSFDENEGEQSNFHLARPIQHQQHRMTRRFSQGRSQTKPEDLSFFPVNVDAYNIFPMKQEIYFKAQKYAVSHLDASVSLTVLDARIYEEDQPPVHFKLIDGTAQSRLHYVCNQGNRLFEDVEPGDRGGEAKIDIQINGSEVTPIEFQAKLLSGFLDKNNPLMELAHDRAQATIYIIPYVQDQKQEELQKSNVFIVEHQIVYEGPEQPFITLRRDMSFYHCTISVTLTLQPPSMTEIAQNEKQATENEHFDPFELVVPFCKYQVEKRVYLEGLKQIQTVVDAKYVVMVKIVSIQEDEESTSNGSDPCRRNRGDILHRSTHPSCKIILQTDRAFLELMSSVEITAVETMNRWKLGFCQMIENAKTTQQLINPISKQVKTRCCQSTTNCVFCIPKMIYTMGGCCQNSKSALLGTLLILILNQLFAAQLFLAMLEIDTVWANAAVMLILIVSGSGMMEAGATLAGFNWKVWDHQVKSKLKQNHSIAEESELNYKFKSDFFFGNFSRAPREEADLFVTKPLSLALYHTLFGMIFFFVNLTISANDLPSAILEEQTRRFALTLILLLLFGVVLVITIRRVADSQCKLQSIYGNPGRRKIIKVSRDQSYRSLSREGSSDSLAQSMKKVKNEPKRVKCQIWSGVVLLLSSLLVAALGSGFVKLS